MASLFKRPNSDNYWYQFRLDGKQYRGSTKTSDKKLAEKIAAAVEADYIRDRFAIPGLIKNNHSLSTVWKEYYKNLNVAPKTKEVRHTSSKHFLPLFEGRKLDDITNIDIEKYQLVRRLEIASSLKNKDKRESEISYRTVNIETGTLYNFFEYCIKNKIIDKNPVAGLKKLKEGKRNIYLSPEEQKRLIASGAPHVMRFIEFAALTGLRKSDVLGLLWENVDLKNMVYKVWIHKSGKWEIKPLSSAAVNVLKNIEKESEYVFTYKGRRIKDIRRSFRTAVRRAGLSHKEGLTPHAMRHVFTTRLTEAGVHPDAIMAATGHMSEKMSERYKHLNPDALRAKLDKAFGGD